MGSWHNDHWKNHGDAEPTSGRNWTLVFEENWPGVGILNLKLIVIHISNNCWGFGEMCQMSQWMVQTPQESTGLLQPGMFGAKMFTKVLVKSSTSPLCGNHLPAVGATNHPKSMVVPEKKWSRRVVNGIINHPIFACVFFLHFKGTQTCAKKIAKLILRWRVKFLFSPSTPRFFPIDSMAMTKRNRWRLEVPTIYVWPIFQALISGHVPIKYGQKHATNVPPF